jgi:predicted Rossmann fold flavoprotein
MIYDIAIIGGGAAGMIAAIAALRRNPLVKAVILERMDRPGKKLLATGNGRCNYTNACVKTSNYHGTDPGFVSRALNSFTSEDAVSFFRELGVFPRVEDDGKIFPYSGTASSVLDALRFELEKLGAVILTGFYTVKIIKAAKGYIISDKSGQDIQAGKVIAAAGGRASPSLGSDGSGYDLLASLGHHRTELSPAITQIKTEGGDVKPLQGIKFFGNASAVYHEKTLSTLYGEVLFTSFGLSGPPIFQLSSKVAENKCDSVSLDLMPDFSSEQVFDILCERYKMLYHLTMENYFTGLINKRIGNLISRRAGIDKLSLPVLELNNDLLTKMSFLIKDLRFKVAGLNGWDNAQVTAGGILTSEFDSETMESLLNPGLYAVGEILDIFGDCGGFNLQWAWSSGYAAGISAAN